jgi:RHS repeat-associated protein
MVQNYSTFSARPERFSNVKKGLYSSPFGCELKGRNLKKTGVNKSFRFGYQGSEADDEFKGDGNSYTTEFRQLDPRLGRWLSIDPKKTAWESPYVSMANNPVMNTDVFGDSLDAKFAKGSAGERAFTEFLNTKEGFNYAAKFAAKGQTVCGKTFTENGAYHVAKIDLSIEGLDVSNYEQGETNQSKDPRVVDGRQKMLVFINESISECNFFGSELKESKANNDDVNNKSAYKKNWNKFMLGRLGVLNHELFIHTEGNVQDFLNDGRYDQNFTSDDDHVFWYVVSKQLTYNKNGAYGNCKDSRAKLHFETGAKILRDVSNKYKENFTHAEFDLIMLIGLQKAQ